jgi:voltage-gated potassium channel Kch
VKKNIKFTSKLRYWFDQTMASGTGSLIAWLGVVSLLIILVFGAVIAATGVTQQDGEPLSFAEAAWETMMRTIDSGTMGGDTGWTFRFVMLLVTICGIFVVSTLIGILSSGIEGKLDELRKGRSQVLEQDHTIILNWSPSIFDVISELVIANESRRNPRIVIMANRDKVEMEDEIAAKIDDLKNTKVICRSGDPTDLTDLSIVNANTSRSIVILSPDAADPDSSVIKTILAITQNPQRRAAKYRIAAEIRDVDNAELATIVGGDETQLVLADDLISRIVAHSSRQPGLSAVYTELLDFDGSEIYTIEAGSLAGRFFGQACLAFEASTLFGLVTKDGEVVLNPAADRKIAGDERLIVIAEDDDAIDVSEIKGGIDTSMFIKEPVIPAKPERTLLLGWNRRAPMIATELSRFVAPGSVLTIVADTSDLANKTAGIVLASDNLALDVRIANSSSRSVIRALDPLSYDHVLVLGYNEDLDPQPADTRTLVTLLHLRQIAEEAGRRASVVSEMIDIRNRELAEVSRADDFVVSNKLVSLMLAQSAENEFMSRIFGTLLDEKGAEIYLRPASSYVPEGVTVDGYQLTLAGLLRGEVVVGYRQRSDAPDERRLGGVKVNPPKTDKVSFGPGDQIVVVANG